MTKEPRSYPRTPLSLNVELTLENGHTVHASTCDISEGGVGISLTSTDATRWQIGMIVSAQVLGLPEEAPKVPMQVVQISEERMGLKIIQN